MHVSRLMQFKPRLFKGQLYILVSAGDWFQDPSTEPTFKDAQVPHRQPSVCKDAELMDMEGDCNPASKICYFLIFHSHLHGFSPFKK